MSVYSKNVKKSIYVPINKHKYVGKNIDNIVCRSSLERKFCIIADNSKSIIQWSSECVVIPYFRSYENKKPRFYVMDFWIKKELPGGIVKEYLIEIKPSSFLHPPKIPKRKTKRYADLVMNYSINVSKWKRAIEYCKEKNMEFSILTEQHLI